MQTIVDSRFWMARSAYDAERLFDDPVLLWKAACSYFDWCDKNPLIDRIAGKDGKVVERELTRVFTKEGLCQHLNCSRKKFDQYKTDAKAACIIECDKPCESDCEQCGKTRAAEAILEVMERMDDTIYRQKYEGAAVGIFSATIIAKDLGIADKEKEFDNQSPILLDFSDNTTANSEAAGGDGDSGQA
ncbi:MAG: hypothetical protein EOP56_08145 [Sphingobacteriales bacterium]|nr:MAG: hypothetical protein EOP56_08145 [Sphingobacteriales bacterium]